MHGNGSIQQLIRFTSFVREISGDGGENLETDVLCAFIVNRLSHSIWNYQKTLNRISQHRSKVKLTAYYMLFNRCSV